MFGMIIRKNRTVLGSSGVHSSGQVVMMVLWNIIYYTGETKKEFEKILSIRANIIRASFSPPKVISSNRFR